MSHAFNMTQSLLFLPSQCQSITRKIIPCCDNLVLTYWKRRHFLSHCCVEYSRTQDHTTMFPIHNSQLTASPHRMQCSFNHLFFGLYMRRIYDHGSILNEHSFQEFGTFNSNRLPFMAPWFQTLLKQVCHDWRCFLHFSSVSFYTVRTSRYI